MNRPMRFKPDLSEPSCAEPPTMIATGTNLSVHTAGHLAAVAAELNERLRKTLDWQTPAERLDQILQPAAA